MYQIIVFLIFTIAAQGFSQSINWLQVYHDDYGKPLYTGGAFNSNPAFADIDGDGDYDYFQGCKDGTIWYFENTGTPDSAAWHFVTDQYNNMKFDVYGYEGFVNVTFTDIDSDGDLDMFVGGLFSAMNKGIHFYKNIGNKNEPAWEFIIEKYQNIETYDGAYNHCKTTFADLDNDNDLDLIVGKTYKDALYINKGDSISPLFVLENEDIFEIGNRWFDFHKPVLVDIDNNMTYDCFVGLVLERILFFSNVGTADSAIWEEITENYNDISLKHTAPEFCNIDGDADFDMFVGTDETVVQYKNIGGSEAALWQIRKDNSFTIDVGSFSSPALCDIDGDNLPELFITNGYHSSGTEPYSSIYFYENFGDISRPDWRLDTTAYFNIHYPDMGSPVLIDIDNDQDYDMLIPYYNSEIMLHENTGDKNNPLFSSSGTIIVDFETNGAAYYQLALVDIDNDLDVDMYISSNDALSGSPPDLVYFRNDGTAEIPDWKYVETYNNYPYGSVAFMDEDNDGDYDMFFGGWGSEWGQENIYFFRNTGDKTSPEFEFVTKDYAGIHVGGWQVPVFYDIDNDQDLDLLIGEEDGGVNLYINDSLNGINEHGSQLHLPDSPELFQNYPNPFNNNTVINLYMNEPSEIELYICDINGKRVKNILNGHLTTGNHRIEWDGVSETGKNVASGAYFCVLKGDGFFKKIKLLLIK